MAVVVLVVGMWIRMWVRVGVNMAVLLGRRHGIAGSGPVLLVGVGMGMAGSTLRGVKAKDARTRVSHIRSSKRGAQHRP